ncbi:MAG: hypothetical protein RMZ43_000115 [Nostoc sp. CmiVER01]|uniref:hypothetical protein n=1 Tax=Nostoc sp. CmiVER01 TaxID=3075384 RepID=UPI002AD503B2|nr:hypothetical protein [Nostoc sp. CmiVER01]MDZ8121876.1 hypothetical protein [Nostoc sp. CmiVER01]
MSLLLYHCFPRHLSTFRSEINRDIIVSEELYHQIGNLLLKSILENGLLLTPESFSVRDSQYLHRQNLWEWQTPSQEQIGNRFQMQQVRACFTLATAFELKRPIPGTSPLSSHNQGASSLISHFDLFGGFAIGLDPIEARSLGAIPTIYHYPPVNNYTSPLYSYGTGSTLSFELISRLIEARKLLIGLAYIEALADGNCEHSLTIRQLQEMGQTLDDEPKSVIEAASHLNKNLAKQIYPLFDTERVPIWNIIEHIELLLSLFQVADSLKRDRPLAYFQQKEWRIIQYNKQGLDCKPLFVKESNQRNHEKIDKLLDYSYQIDNLLKKPVFQTMFDRIENTRNFWLLMSCDRLNFRDFIKQIIVPDCALESTQALVSKVYLKRNIPRVISHSQITEEETC